MNTNNTVNKGKPQTVLRTLITGESEHPVLIGRNDFKFKSLSDFVCNTTIGCSHGCLFCYVAQIMAAWHRKTLGEYGVKEPDAEWGNYVIVRDWDEEKFLASLRSAENCKIETLKPEGHRAVMFCSTTDPYQTIGGKHTKQHQQNVRRALALIRDHSTLNVRILTRSPLAKTDFKLMASFKHRLMFGMSLPTLNDKLARVYEPHAPGVQKRLETLQAAKEAGLNVYVAMAPTYPDCDEADIRATLEAIAELEPLTVFHEPINVRGDNVERIRKQANIPVNLDPFQSDNTWRTYAVNQLKLVERVAGEVGLGRCLHLWPDKDLATSKYLETLEDPTGFVHWLHQCWTRISEWPEPAPAALEDKAL